MKGWEIVDNKLTKEFVFKNFGEAIKFVNTIANVAEARDHHPDILIHSYKKVKIMLFTHIVKAITEKDRDLASAIDSIEKQL